MNTFALITEGKTDQIVIEYILAGYFKNYDLDVNELQPPGDETDENRSKKSFGGWHKVFEYCQSEEFREAFQTNEYVIIQIDTDESEKKHYDIPKYEKGQELTPEQLTERVIEKFRKLITDKFYDNIKGRIIFAISVHSVECWLLPFCYTDKDRKKRAATKNCLKRADAELRKKGLKIVLADKKPEAYEEISKDYFRHKILMKLYKENPSLKIFIKEIQKKNIIIQKDGLL